MGARVGEKVHHSCDLITRWFTHLLLGVGPLATAEGCRLVVECMSLVGDSVRAREGEGVVRLSAPDALDDATGDPPGLSPFILPPPLGSSKYIYYPPPPPLLLLRHYNTSKYVFGPYIPPIY